MTEEKWVAVWANSPGVVQRTNALYAKDLTLRYPISCSLGGNTLRFVFSNKYGKEPVVINQITVGLSSGDGKVLESTLTKITFKGKAGVAILPGKSVRSDEIPFRVRPGSTLCVSMYVSEFTSMRSGISFGEGNTKGYAIQGNQVEKGNLPATERIPISEVYFMTEVDIWTEKENGSIVCFGDTLTAGTWPEELAIRCEALDMEDVAIVRRAIPESTVLRDFSEEEKAHCAKAGVSRFDREIRVPGARAVIVLHGLGDLFHPRSDSALYPMSTLPTAEELIRGMNYYIKVARARNLEIYFGTIPPFKGHPAYNPQKDKVRNEVNQWIRECEEADGVIDFDELLCKEDDPKYLNPAYDSGDHLHLNAEGYRMMAEEIPPEALMGPEA